MHVSVQKFTRTTWPPQPGGAEWLRVEPLGRAGERGHVHTFERGHRYRSDRNVARSSEA